MEAILKKSGIKWKGLILDFWFSCEVFGKLMRINKTTVVWGNCDEKSEFDYYKEEMCGYKMSSYLNEEQKYTQREKDLKTIQKLAIKEEIIRTLECQIWSEIVGLEVNLQWTKWGKIFWFDWLILWMWK